MSSSPVPSSKLAIAPPSPWSLTAGWNVITCADWYKGAHHKLLNPAFQHGILFHYVESRGGDFDQIVSAGASFVAKALSEYTLTTEHIEEALELFRFHGVSEEQLGLHFNVTRWEAIITKHGGKLPLCVSALPDGTVVPPRTPLMTVYNTDPDFPWLPGYIESWLLSNVWYMTSVATKSLAMRNTIADGLIATGDDPAFAEVMLVDFGVRGVTGGSMGGVVPGPAALGGFAHLMVGKSSDNLPALHFSQRWGFLAVLTQLPPTPPSILATEHSVMTSFGREEQEAFAHILDTVGDHVPISIVMDSYHLFMAISTLYNQFGDRIKKRTAPIVVRPDSGKPTEIVPQVLAALHSWFGGTVNEQGFTVLPDTIRVIQGDGISVDGLKDIVAAVVHAKFSLSNLVFGSGGGLLQSATRDTLKFAYKASAAVNTEGVVQLMSKDPVTDPGKKSKEGFLAVEAGGGDRYTTVVYPTLVDLQASKAPNLLRPYYDKGLLVRFDTLSEMRGTVNTTLAEAKAAKKRPREGVAEID